MSAHAHTYRAITKMRALKLKFSSFHFTLWYDCIRKRESVWKWINTCAYKHHKVLTLTFIYHQPCTYLLSRHGGRWLFLCSVIAILKTYRLHAIDFYKLHIAILALFTPFCSLLSLSLKLIDKDSLAMWPH